MVSTARGGACMTLSGLSLAPALATPATSTNVSRGAKHACLSNVQSISLATLTRSRYSDFNTLEHAVPSAAKNNAMANVMGSVNCNTTSHHITSRFQQQHSCEQSTRERTQKASDPNTRCTPPCMPFPLAASTTNATGIQDATEPATASCHANM